MHDQCQAANQDYVMWFADGSALVSEGDEPDAFIDIEFELTLEKLHSLA